MKKMFLVAATLMISLFSINNAKAQLNVSINIGSQPVWGPVGYDHVDYYYLPDIGVYYYVPTGQYIYLNNNNWIWANSLPSRYSNFNLYTAYKVVINSPKPYLHNSIYVNKYSRYKNYYGKQTIIRDSREPKYYVVKGHPNYKPNAPVNRPQPNVRPSRPQGNVERPSRNHNNQVNRPERNGQEHKNERH